MFTKTLRLSRCIVPISALLVSACAIVPLGSSYSYEESVKLNSPIKSSLCFDAAVLVERDMDLLKSRTKLWLISNDFAVEDETETKITAQRNRHFGFFQPGRGGESLRVTFLSTKNGRVFVTAVTTLSVIGIGGQQRGWSCELVDTIL